jgi:hypothetical protein
MNCVRLTIRAYFIATVLTKDDAPTPAPRFSSIGRRISWFTGTTADRCFYGYAHGVDACHACEFADDASQ